MCAPYCSQSSLAQYHFLSSNCDGIPVPCWYVILYVPTPPLLILVRQCRPCQKRFVSNGAGQASNAADDDEQIDYVWKRLVAKPFFSRRKFNIGLLAYVVVSRLPTAPPDIFSYFVQTRYTALTSFRSTSFAHVLNCTLTIFSDSVLLFQSPWGIYTDASGNTSKLSAVYFGIVSSNVFFRNCSSSLINWLLVPACRAVLCRNRHILLCFWYADPTMLFIFIVVLTKEKKTPKFCSSFGHTRCREGQRSLPSSSSRSMSFL